MIKNKKCNKCGVKKADIPENYNYIKKGFCELRSVCKTCCALYYIDNAERIKAVGRKNRLANLEKHKTYQKQYYIENKKVIDAKNKKYAKNNINKIRDHKQKWIKDNLEKNADCKQKYNRRIRRTERGRLNDRIRSAIHKSLKGNKNGKSWERLVNYTYSDLKIHLENLFTKNMSWINMGEWHVDHIIPISAFSFTKPEDKEFQKCWALSNLQPLWAIDNLVKSNKI